MSCTLRRVLWVGAGRRSVVSATAQRMDARLDPSLQRRLADQGLRPFGDRPAARWGQTSSPADLQAAGSVKAPTIARSEAVSTPPEDPVSDTVSPQVR